VLADAWQVQPSSGTASTSGQAQSSDFLDTIGKGVNIAGAGLMAATAGFFGTTAQTIGTNFWDFITLGSKSVGVGLDTLWWIDILQPESTSCDPWESCGQSNTSPPTTCNISDVCSEVDTQAPMSPGDVGIWNNYPGTGWSGAADPFGDTGVDDTSWASTSSIHRGPGAGREQTAAVMPALSASVYGIDIHARVITSRLGKFLPYTLASTTQQRVSPAACSANIYNSDIDFLHLSCRNLVFVRILPKTITVLPFRSLSADAGPE